MAEYVIAADVGGTNIRAAAVDEGGGIHGRTSAKTPREGTRGELVECIASIARELAEKTTATDFGLAIPALIDYENELISKSPNLPQLEGSEFAKEITERSGLNVIFENDATAAAIGEHWLGASKGAMNAFCITLGTGVGGGLILNGKAFRGVDGTAGEIGHVCVEPDGPPCGCGSNGCLEQFASATAIVRMANEGLANYPESPLTSIDSFSAKDVFEAGIKGDRLAVEVYATAGRYLGIAIAGLVNVLNLEVVVIAGGVSAAFDLFIGETRSEVRKRAFQQPAERVNIVRGALGNNAGILGAARQAFARR